MFPDYLQQARVAKGLNQSQLAKALRVTPQAVQSWESGKAKPRQKTLLNLAQVLETTMDALLLGVFEKSTQVNGSKVTAPFCIVAPNVLLNDRVLAEDILGYQDFSLADLKANEVNDRQILCTHLLGNSMAPTMPHKTLMAFDMSNHDVIDGSIYALSHFNEVRIKVVYRLPGQGLRLSSYNSEGHPDERYSAEKIVAEGIRILGKAFWYSRFI